MRNSSRRLLMVSVLVLISSGCGVGGSTIFDTNEVTVTMVRTETVTAPGATRTKTVTKTVTASPEEPNGREDPSPQLTPPVGEGFYMPDLIGLSINDGLTFLFAEYGLTPDRVSYPVDTCAGVGIPRVWDSIPGVGEWVSTDETGRVISLTGRCG
jgi:hypothetical protein